MLKMTCRSGVSNIILLRWKAHMLDSTESANKMKRNLSAMTTKQDIYKNPTEAIP